MIVCVCHAVTDEDVVDHVTSGCCATPDDVADDTGATTSCGTCVDRVCGLVQATRAVESVLAAAPVA